MERMKTSPEGQRGLTNIVYRDHANVEESSSDGEGSCESNFPVRLHYVLAEMEADGLQHVASWQPHGRCFIIRNQKEFVANVLPL